MTGGLIRRLVALVVLAIGVQALPLAEADAQRRVASRRMGVRWAGGVPHLTFSARDLITADGRRKLQSGLPQTVVMRTYGYRQGRRSAVAVTLRSCRVVYDLWEEVYRVQVQSPSTDRTYTVRGIERVLERCLVSRRVHVGRQSDWSVGQRVYFATLVELNPLSPATVTRIRRWLARPNHRVEGDAFFGSFVSLFVNRRIGQAERTVRFRSQTVEVPP